MQISIGIVRPASWIVVLCISIAAPSCGNSRHQTNDAADDTVADTEDTIGDALDADDTTADDFIDPPGDDIENEAEVDVLADSDADSPSDGPDDTFDAAEDAPTEPTGGLAGDPCENDDDCLGLFTCSHYFLGTPIPNGYCVGDCENSSDCGLGGVCLDPFSGPAGNCYHGCEDDTDCRVADGFDCSEWYGYPSGMVYACLPW